MTFLPPCTPGLPPIPPVNPRDERKIAQDVCLIVVSSGDMTSKAMTTRSGPPPGKDTAGAGAPNQTLYVKNLPEKLNKNELKRALYMLFSTHGPVLDIVTMRGSMRGQAHVAYRDIQTSTQAMRTLQGFEFFGKELNIAYAKGQSQIVPKLRGTFEPTATAPVTSEATDLQKSIFNAPPPSMPAKPTEVNGVKPASDTTEKLPQGVKRPREEEEAESEASEAGDASMDEDDEDDAPMEASSDED